MNKEYGVVVIGCGYIGEEHLADIYYRDNIRIVAVVDWDSNKAQLMAKKYGASEYGTDYTHYLNRNDVDIVIIATYVDSHLHIMKDCVNAGKHVLCEKPVASTRAEGEEFFRIAEKSTVQVLVGHILRHNRSYQKVKELIDTGTIGDLRLIHFVQNHHALDWHRYRRLFCQGIYRLDITHLSLLLFLEASAKYPKILKSFF
ncbi:MAG: Gfo/Idh/MocA family oxidoreductase [Lachnospiraceae bacterium]|nr:Gfo/Idh/MocA family oxidoreductase [Lachnospiraceae bacterium]